MVTRGRAAVLVLAAALLVAHGCGNESGPQDGTYEGMYEMVLHQYKLTCDDA